MTKSELRKLKIAARDALTPEDRRVKSENICRQILASPLWKEAATVLLYKFVRGEVQLTLLEEENARSHNPRRLAYPLCEKDGIMRAVTPGNSGAWRRGPFGIPEPDPNRGTIIPPEDIDLVICPCTAFDSENRRLGMGGGYYDRFLPLCANAHVAAVAFAVQKADKIPADSRDQPVDFVFQE